MRRGFSVHVHALPQAPPSHFRAAWISFRQRRPLSTAFYVVLTVLRNILGCVFCALCANFCYSLGNIFTLRVSTYQSTESIIVANLVWTNVLYYGITLVTYSTALQSQRFITSPETRPSLRFCITKLARATWRCYAVSVFLILAWGILFVNMFPVTWRWMRLDFFIGATVNHIFAAAIARATKHTYDHETCKGHLRRQKRAPQPTITDTNGSSSLNVPTQSRSFWRVYLKTFPEVMCAMGAGVYVQLASQNQLFSRGATAVLIFALVSFAVKLLLQELAKAYVMKRNIHQVYIMCMLVGLPTVLIDTQVRIIMLGKQSTNHASAGTLTMAVSETLLRIGKVMLIKWQIRHREAEVLCTDSAHQKQQILDFHTAEVMADMYAEYIAIACSASILFFFANNPKYQVVDDMTASKVVQLQWLLVYQLGLEIVVDYVSCVFEIAVGVQFERVRKLSVFLAFMFMTIAVVNISISSFLYLK
uniref:Uncharacterized protein n=1 Tax=Globisporangium ultimum (strain ATCC 200006 / CBS 805.95 / DAOM BR144) TaxID=431595 RepID=K3WFQ1_GLOUD